MSSEYGSFVQANGKTLSTRMKLSDWLDKGADDNIDNTPIELKMKATTATQTANSNVTLNLSVGNEDNPSAYVSEKDVVTWKAGASAPPTAPITVAHSSIQANNPATLSFTNTTSATITSGTIKCGDIRLEIINYDKFERVGGGSFAANMPLHEFLGGAHTADTPLTPGTPLTVAVKATQATIDANAEEKLNMAIKHNTDTAISYMAATDVVTWTKGSMELVAKTDKITGSSPTTLTLTNNTGVDVSYSNIYLKINNYSAFESVVAGNSVTLKNTNMSLDAFVSTTGTLTSGSSLDIAVKATQATIDANAEKKLNIAIGTGTNPDTYMVAKDVVTWTKGSIELTAETDKITGSSITMLTFKNNTGSAIKKGDIFLTIQNGAAFEREFGECFGADPMSLDVFLGSGSAADLILSGDEVKVAVKATQATIDANAEKKLNIAIGTVTNPDTYMTAKDVVTWKQLTITIDAISLNRSDQSWKEFGLKVDNGEINIEDLIFEFKENTNSFLILDKSGKNYYINFSGYPRVERFTEFTTKQVGKVDNKVKFQICRITLFGFPAKLSLTVTNKNTNVVYVKDQVIFTSS